MSEKEKHTSHDEETSEDLLKYAQALNWLKITFPEDTYKFRNAGDMVAEEIKQRLTKPETADAKEEV